MKNKKIIITGATGGIGEELVKLLDGEGAELFLIGSDLTKLKLLKDQLKAKVTFAQCDLSKAAGIKDAAAIISEIDDVDILINLAGISYFGSLGLQKFEAIEKLYNVNLLAPTVLCQAVLPEMVRKNKGHIVNIGSIFGSIAFPYFATYSASKAGLRSFSEALRREVEKANIKVSYIVPRAGKTKINNDEMVEFSQKTHTKVDSAELVAQKVLQAIKQQKKYAYLGFPEKFFVYLNYLFPSLVDGALQKQAAVAREILTEKIKL